MDRNLLNLKILGRVPKNGRIRRGPGGIIALEHDGLLTSIKRYMLSDGRKQTLQEIQSIVHQTSEKAIDLLNSRWMEVGPPPEKLPKFPEEHRTANQTLGLMMAELGGALKGIDNLKTTYWNDASTCSELDLVAVKIEVLLQNISRQTASAPIDIPNARQPSPPTSKASPPAAKMSLDAFTTPANSPHQHPTFTTAAAGAGPLTRGERGVELAAAATKGLPPDRREGGQGTKR